MTKNKNKKKKDKKKKFFITCLCFLLNVYFLYSLFSVWKQIYDKKSESKKLSVQLVNLQEKEEELKVEVNKLNDPEYVAKYAREKFLYSGENEYIIQIK